MSILTGNVFDILPTLEAESVNCCVTSPPYWGLRDYGTDCQLGIEPTPELYVANLVAVFREVWRVLRDDGTLWLNLGDSYAGSWGNQGRKSERGTQRPVNGPMIQNVGGVAHTIGCDMDEDCTCGARVAGVYPDKRTCTGSWVNDHPTLKPKDLVGIPWRVAFALQADGWYLRSDIIWSKPNPMPESVTDRPTKAHEYVFLMSKRERYWYDAAAIAETMNPASAARYEYGFGGKKNEHLKATVNQTAVVGNRDATATRNRRTVWTIATQPYPEAHFATFPEKLVEPCVLAGCPAGGTVLDPFTGSGTTGAVAYRLGRKFVGIELNPEYAALAEKRIAPWRDQMQLDMTGATP